MTRDESIRPDTTAAKLAALKPAFTQDGTVTAGNSSPINDGAIATFVGTREMAAALGVEPLGRIVASATVGVDAGAVLGRPGAGDRQGARPRPDCP